MQFSTFSEYMQKLEKISSRLEMTAVLAELFRKLDTDETVEACYLLQGQLQSPYQAVEFQIAVKTVIKALARLFVAEKHKADAANLFGESDFSHQETIVAKMY